MENYSLTYTSVIVLVLGEILKVAGVNVGSEALTTTVLTIIQIVGAITILVERFKKGGITALGAKIK
jgi:ABC-type iron transport system FetAB permease component